MDFRKEDKPDDDIVGDFLNNLTGGEGSMLPTNGDVLRHFLFLTRNELKQENCKFVMNVVLNKVKEIWNQASIPSQDVNKQSGPKTKLKSLIDGRNNIVTYKKRSNFDEHKAKFNSKLGNLFDIAKQNAEEGIKKDRLKDEFQKISDVEFLCDQRNERKFCMDGMDNSFMKKVVKQHKRKQCGDILKQKEIDRSGKGSGSPCSD